MTRHSRSCDVMPSSAGRENRSFNSDCASHREIKDEIGNKMATNFCNLTTNSAKNQLLRPLVLGTWKLLTIALRTFFFFLPVPSLNLGQTFFWFGPTHRTYIYTEFYRDLLVTAKGKSLSKSVRRNLGQTLYHRFVQFSYRCRIFSVTFRHQSIISS